MSKNSADKGKINEAQSGLFEAPQSISHTGHRQRLRARFMKSGAQAMPDYELLEMVLFRAIERRDTKNLAKALLKKFGTFAGVINASESRLREVKGIGQAAIVELKLIRASALRMMQTAILDKPIFASWQAVLDYCHAAMANEEKEQFRILFLDKKNRLIEDEVQSQGTVDHTPVYIREVIKRALELSASALLLVHNHPSGDPHPSRADIDMTRRIISAAEPFGIVVHDHIIIAREGHASFKGLALI